MRDIVDVMLAVNAQAYSFEAGNVRHEHEWTVWEEVKLPDGKIIMPGVVISRIVLGILAFIPLAPVQRAPSHSPVS